MAAPARVARNATSKTRMLWSMRIDSPAPRRAAATRRAAAAGEAVRRRCARRESGLGCAAARSARREPDELAQAAAAVRPLEQDMDRDQAAHEAAEQQRRHAREEREEECAEDADEENVGPARHVEDVRLAVGGAPFPLSGILGEHVDDGVDGAADAGADLAGTERRGELLLDDQPGDRVGERAFEAVADLDAH